MAKVKSKKLFDDDRQSDDEIAFEANSEYAKKYNTLRRKEELLKLKNKYGDGEGSDESSSESEDDDDVALPEQFEREFFKTLSCLKNKDPRIYDPNVRFFSKENEASVSKPDKNKKNEKPLKIRDYNRKIITEKDGKFSDDEDDDNYEEDNPRSNSPTYIEEQRQLKMALSKAANDDDDDDNDDSNIAGMFSKRKLTKEEEEAEEKSYREWLSGEIKHLRDNADEKDLKPLKEFWTNPTLEEEEAFLRDYFLNQRFREPTSKKTPTYEDIVNDSDHELSEDERLVEEQLEFEENFNYRFEEPDQDFIKRYPRTLEHSMRKKDNKRARKRAEVKERKLEEKKKKQEEIKQLKSLKLKEIQEKIMKIKEITGNDQLAFDDDDIEGDFDPDEHDRKMNEIFNDGYYGEVDNSKPEFPELDEELEIDNWDKWEDSEKSNKHNEPHCEDDDFNMDCDYNPVKSKLDSLQETGEGKRKRRKRKNKLAEALARKKPLFDPTKDASFSQYLDEYYKLDCEDVIGDLPCRFKYREVPPTDYGLTTAEILMADDKELNKWYPLKKALQYRPEHRDVNDQKMYSAKGRNYELKKKILPSLFSTPSDEVENEDAQPGEQPTKKKKKRKNKNKKSNSNDNPTNDETENNDEKQNRKRKHSVGENSENNVEIKPEGKKKKSKQEQNNPEPSETQNGETGENKPQKKGKKNKNKQDDSTISEIKSEEDSSNKRKKKVDKVDSQAKSEDTISDKKKKKKYKPPKEQQSSDPLSNISDERLKAYGLNPKKYKDFLKYKKY